MNFTQEQVNEIMTTIAEGENGYQKILKLSLEAIMRAERNEFKTNNNDVSNGSRFRSVLVHGGKLELAIPRCRHNNFYPLILAFVKDQQEEYKELAYELYTAGLTTEQVGSMFERIYGHHYCKSSISAMMETARTDIASWLERPIDAFYPILYIDATYWYTRRGDTVSSEAYYTILAVKKDKTREVLAIVNHPTEGSSNWKEAFEGLKKRGLERVNLVVCDGLTGIENAIAEAFPQSKTQLCTVHLTRNILSKVKPEDKDAVAKEMSIVLNPDIQTDSSIDGHKRFMEFIDAWKKKYPSLKCYLEPRNHLYFTYLNYDVRVRRMIYSTNWIERLNRDFKRTLRMRASMPSPDSVVFLLGSVAKNRKAFSTPVYAFVHENRLFD